MRSELLKTLALAGLLWGGATDAVRAFDGASYLCNPEQPHLKGFRDVIALHLFLPQIKERAVYLDRTDCTQGWSAGHRRIVQTEDPAQAASSLVAFARARAARRAQLAGFEARYVNDAEMMLHMVLFCDALGASRDICLGTGIRKLPALVVADSPVLCDFAAPKDRAPLAPGEEMSPALDALPFLCSGSQAGQDAASAAWLRRASKSLFPSPCGDGMTCLTASGALR